MSPSVLRPATVPFVAALAVIGVGALSFTPVPSGQSALVLRMGQPVRTEAGGGPVWHWPLAEAVVPVDTRVMTLPLFSQTATTADGQPLRIDAYATWQVTDPAKFHAALGNTAEAVEPIRAMLAAAIAQAVGAHPAADASALQQGRDADALHAAFDRALADYGARAGEVRIMGVNLPDGAPMEAALARMTASAQADAAVIATQGHRDAQVIRADAEAEASRIYAASYGKDPEFFDFWRAMQSYDATFAQKGSHTTLVLSPDNAYLKQFKGK